MITRQEYNSLIRGSVTYEELKTRHPTINLKEAIGAYRGKRTRLSPEELDSLESELLALPPGAKRGEQKKVLHRYGQSTLHNALKILGYKNIGHLVTGNPHLYPLLKALKLALNPETRAIYSTIAPKARYALTRQMRLTEGQYQELIENPVAFIKAHKQDIKRLYSTKGE
jgi:hypothetical protein